VPNVKFNVGNKADAEAGGSRYTGKRPPHKTIYRVKVKRLGMKINAKNDFMLNAVLEINEPDSSPKSKYNGYGFWWNGNINDAGAGYVNQFLDSISGGKKAIREAFWAGKCRTEAKPKKGEVTPVLAIGALRISQDGMDSIVFTRLARKWEGKQELGVDRWLLESQLTEDMDDDAVDDDDDAEDVDTDVEDDDDDDDDDDDGDDDDDDDDDDSDDDAEDSDDDDDGDDDDDDPGF
jgi:hypothetical protein